VTWCSIALEGVLAWLGTVLEAVEGIFKRATGVKAHLLSFFVSV
jgi:hypothetical protein